MTNPKQHRCRILGTKRLAATVALMLVVVAAQFAQAQTFNVLHSFNGLDGQQPYDGVTLDGGGNLYGTAYDGGTGAGTVCKLTHHGSGWTFNVLSSFAGGGAHPYAGSGTVYNLIPSPSVCKTSLCPWTESLLYVFTGPPNGYGP